MDLMFKYVKLLEEDKIKYRFEIDGIIYLVSFVNDNDNIYLRSYINDDGINIFRLVNKNPFKILQAVTFVTQNFIDEYKPDAIVMEHLAESLEWQHRNNKPNRRAIANYRYLKNIEGYKTHYFISKYIDTKCILSKTHFNYDTLINKNIYTEFIMD